MTSWSQESALHTLSELHTQAAVLDGSAPGSEELVRWTLHVRRVLSEIFGEASDYFRSFDEIRWGSYSTGVVGGPARRAESFDINLGIARLQRESTSRALSTSRGILRAASDELSLKGVSQVHRAKDTGPEASAILTIVTLAERKLRRTMRSAPKDEREVQDRFEDLLNGASVSFKREKEHVTYSSKTYIPDFTVEHADLAIEIKFCNRPGREREIIAEINDDIMAYGTKWGNLIFVVYDLTHIRDVDEFVSEFGTETVLVVVVKH